MIIYPLLLEECAPWQDLAIKIEISNKSQLPPDNQRKASKKEER